MDTPTLVVVFIFVVLIIVAVTVRGLGAAQAAVAVDLLYGGAETHRKKNGRRLAAEARPDVVVDTLNLAHWLHGKPRLDFEDIIATINATAGPLKKQHPGMVIYVTKDRESVFNDTTVRDRYQQTARANLVCVAVAEQYKDPPPGVRKSDDHSTRGRDDFFMSLLAQRHSCAVVTGDRLRDFAKFRSRLPPFTVFFYNYWKDPEREYIQPRNYTKLLRPVTISPDSVLDHKQVSMQRA